MALVRDEYIIRKTSTAVVSTVMTFIRDTYLNPKQEASDNKTVDNKYKNFYFGDLFDARDGSLYRVWSSGATTDPSMVAGSLANGDSFYALIKMDQFATKPQIADFKNATEINDMIDQKLESLQIDAVIIG